MCRKTLTRFWICLVVLLVSAVLILPGCSPQQPTVTPETPKAPENTVKYTRPDTVTGSEAKQLLIDGNKRYVSGQFANIDLSSSAREALVAGQKPFAIIVSCSDSRVPPELLFDQGLGDIFVVRVAGNVADPVAIGSVEYAVEHLGAPLLVVMGHEKCGAVSATVAGGEAPGSIGAIVEKIKPAVDKAKVAGATKDDLVEKSVDENVKLVLASLEKSKIIEEAVKAGHLTITGAKYHLGAGEVTWFGNEK